MLIAPYSVCVAFLGRFLVVDQLRHHHSAGMAEGLDRTGFVVVEIISE
jgi:hypothetical protein